MNQIGYFVYSKEDVICDFIKSTIIENYNNSGVNIISRRDILSFIKKEYCSFYEEDIDRRSVNKIYKEIKDILRKESYYLIDDSIYNDDVYVYINTIDYYKDILNRITPILFIILVVFIVSLIIIFLQSCVLILK